MGFLGALGGYVGGKIGITAVAVGLYVGSLGLGAASLVCPPLAPVAAVTFTMAEAATGFIISPIDPVTAAIAATTAVATGPL